MADTLPLTAGWSGGIKTDLPPNMLLPNEAQTMNNFLIDIFGAPVALRGAWEYGYTANPDLTGVSASSSSLSAIAYAPFPDGVRFICVDQAGRILTVNASGVAASLDATGLGEVTYERPFWHRDRMILVGSSGTAEPWQVTSSAGTATAASFGTDVAPAATTGCSWEGAYLILSNGGAWDAGSGGDDTILKRRSWFSDVGALTFTSSNNSYIDWPDEILYVVPMTGALIGFGRNKCWICTGTTPPATGVTTDLVMRDLYPQGTIDKRSIALWNGYIIWANAAGIWKSDGTSLVNLTDQAQYSRAWRNLTYNFASGWTAAGGVFGNYYIVTVCNAAGVEQQTVVVDLSKSVSRATTKSAEVIFTFTGFPVNMYGPVSTGQNTATVSAQDLLFASNAVSNFGRMQPVFQLGKHAGKDANGVVILFQLITPFYALGSQDEKRLRRVWMSYDWDNTSGYTDTPTVGYTISNTPWTGITSFTALTMPAAGSGRQPLFVNKKGRWIAFNFQLAAGATNGVKYFALFGLDVEAHMLEGSRSDSS